MTGIGPAGTPRLFLLLKPDGIGQEEAIMEILAPAARVVASRRFARPPMRRLAGLYAEHVGQPFYRPLLESFRSQPVKAFILEPLNRGRGAADFHELIASIVGDTDPAKAAKGTIRARSGDSITRSMAEGRTVRNLVHRSRTPADSLREGSLFFNDRKSHRGGGIKVEPFVLDFINPLEPCCGGERIEGIFYEERLADLFRRMDIIPDGAELVKYEETIPLHGQEEGVLLCMNIAYRLAGKVTEVEIEVLDDTVEGGKIDPSAVFGGRG
jgi:nucleoside-diphosphate kinase